MWAIFCLIVICLSLMAPLYAERTYCFTGSSEYQLVPHECTSHKDESTEWYCATMEICEQFMSSGRNCIVTKGCATRAQCEDPNGGVFKNSQTMHPGDSGSKLAGMKITTSCCKNDADSFTDDDLVAQDLSGICNSGNPSVRACIWVTLLLSGAISILVYGL